MHKNNLTASITSLASIKSLNPLIDEINEIAKQLGITTKELKKAYEIAGTKDQVLEALKVVDSAKQQLPDKTKELCSNLKDDTICITYLFAKKIGKEIGKYLSPYLLQNASENLEEYNVIPKDYLKECYKNNAMKLLSKREIGKYLEKKSEELAASKSPSPTHSTTDSFIYDNDIVREETASVMGGEIYIEPLHQ